MRGYRQDQDTGGEIYRCVQTLPEMPRRCGGRPGRGGFRRQDLFKENKPIYKVERVVNLKKLFNDKEHIVFVNCTYQDLTTDIGKLIHDMKSKIGEEKCYNIFSESDEIGEENMGQVCEMIEKMGYDKGVKIGEDNIIVSMLKKGFSIDIISDATEKSKEYILSIKNKLK